MIKCSTIAFVVVAMLGLGMSTGAYADVSGKACVIDGHTLVINGKRVNETCEGGTKVRLYGIVAPAVAQQCKAPDGRDFNCGRYAAKRLLDMVMEKSVYCTGNSLDEEARLLAVCRVAGEDLASILVREGWAKPYMAQTKKYDTEAREAKMAKRGVWAMKMQDPLEWRADQNR